MRRNLLVVAVLAAAGYFGWREFLTPEKRACRRVANLCGESQRADCESLFAKAQTAGGDEFVSSSADCFISADSCAQAAGCSTGLEARIAGAAIGGFLKGLGGSGGK